MFGNYWSINLYCNHDFPSFNDWITRGGPDLYDPPHDWFGLNIYSDSRRVVYFGLYIATWNEEFGSYGNSISPNFDMKLISNLFISFSPMYSHSFNYDEWVTNIDDNLDGQIDHHVFGELTTDILSANIRSDITFTKDITFQLWIQPYIAVGKFSKFKELADPDKYEFMDFEFQSPSDFNQKFLKANIVLRWEYSPGSSLYFIMTNSLSDFLQPGDFSPIRDLKSVFNANGESIYLIKISKWLNI